MDKETRDKVVENIYNRAHYIYKMNIKLDDSVIDEIVSNKKTIYGIDEEDLHIFRIIIGVFSNGDPKTAFCVKERLEKSNNVSYELSKKFKKVFSKLYNANLEAISQKIAFDKNVANTIPIEEICWKRITYKKLCDAGITTLGDFTQESVEKLKVVLSFSGYGRMVLKVQSLGLQLQSESKEEQVSEQLSLSNLTKRKLMYEKAFQLLSSNIDALVCEMGMVGALSENDTSILKWKQIKRKYLCLTDMNKQFEKEYEELCQQINDLNSNDNFSLSA